MNFLRWLYRKLAKRQLLMQPVMKMSHFVVMRSFVVLIIVTLYKLLNKQPNCWWFETTLTFIWQPCNVPVITALTFILHYCVVPLVTAMVFIWRHCIVQLVTAIWCPYDVTVYCSSCNGPDVHMTSLYCSSCDGHDVHMTSPYIVPVVTALTFIWHHYIVPVVTQWCPYDVTVLFQL